MSALHIHIQNFFSAQLYTVNIVLHTQDDSKNATLYDSIHFYLFFQVPFRPLLVNSGQSK